MKAMAMTWPSMRDELVGLELLAVLGDEVVERADQAVVEERHDRVVGDHRHRVLGRVHGQRRDLDGLVLGGGVGRHRHGVRARTPRRRR